MVAVVVAVVSVLRFFFGSRRNLVSKHRGLRREKRKVRREKRK